MTRWTLRRARLANPFPSWVQDLRSSSTMATGQTTLAWARDRQGLTSVEAIGALAFYLIDTVARMCRRQHPVQNVEPYLRDLRVLAECQSAGETLPTPSGTRPASAKTARRRALMTRQASCPTASPCCRHSADSCRCFRTPSWGMPPGCTPGQDQRSVSHRRV